MARTDPLLTLGFSAISWIEHFLVHGPGDVQGQEIELDDEFAAFIVKGYRLNRNGSRRVRRAFLSRAKGRSKSGLAGFIACFEALGPARFDHFAEKGEVSDWGYEYAQGEPVGRPLTYAEILCVATEEGQAGNTYDGIYFMLHHETCSEALLARYGRIDVGLTRINLPDKRGFIEPVTAANESKDGGKSTFIVADETHLWVPPAKLTGKFRLGKMHQTMVRNLLKRKVASGWMLETSTMYADGEGSVAEGTHAYALALKKAGRDDGKLLFDHKQASDHWNLNKRSERIKALKEAYGPAAAWMDLQAIADYWDDPQASHAEFRRFFLNQPVPTEEPTPSIFPGWPACAVELAEPPPVMAIGVAVSVDKAFTSIAAAGKWDDDSVNLDAVDRRPGSVWVPAEVKRIQDTYGCVVVIDEKCPDPNLIRRLKAAGVQLLELNLEQCIEACSDFDHRIKTLDLTHMSYDELDDAIAVAAWRDIGDGRQLLGRKRSTGDISMAEAAVNALRGISHARVPMAAFV